MLSDFCLPMSPGFEQRLRGSEEQTSWSGGGSSLLSAVTSPKSGRGKVTHVCTHGLLEESSGRGLCWSLRCRRSCQSLSYRSLWTPVNRLPHEEDQTTNMLFIFTEFDSPLPVAVAVPVGFYLLSDNM